eukprot:4286289-Amphidinium_carterae.2
MSPSTPCRLVAALNEDQWLTFLGDRLSGGYRQMLPNLHQPCCPIKPETMSSTPTAETPTTRVAKLSTIVNQVSEPGVPVGRAEIYLADAHMRSEDMERIRRRGASLVHQGPRICFQCSRTNAYGSGALPKRSSKISGGDARLTTTYGRVDSESSETYILRC